MRHKFDRERVIRLIERILRIWRDDLDARADRCGAMLKDSRIERARLEPGEYRYTPLTLRVDKRRSLDLGWQEVWCRRRTPGSAPEPWYLPIRRRPARSGGGYDFDVLTSKVPESEKLLVIKIEEAARLIRLEYSDLMAVKRGLTTLAARKRRREEMAPKS